MQCWEILTPGFTSEDKSFVLWLNLRNCQQDFEISCWIRLQYWQHYRLNRGKNETWSCKILKTNLSYEDMINRLHLYSPLHVLPTTSRHFTTQASIHPMVAVRGSVFCLMTLRHVEGSGQESNHWPFNWWLAYFASWTTADMNEGLDNRLNYTRRRFSAV